MGSVIIKIKYNQFSFALATAAPCSLPCIGVAADPNGIGELCFESWESSKPAREDEIEKAPQLAQVVLDRGSCEDQTVYRPDLLTDESHLRGTHAWTRIWWSTLQHFVPPCARFDCTTDAIETIKQT